jgi:hypothetical protein
MGSAPEKRKRSTVARSGEVSPWRSEILFSAFEASNQPARRVATTSSEHRLCKCRTMHNVVIRESVEPNPAAVACALALTDSRLIGDGRVCVGEVGDIQNVGQGDSPLIRVLPSCGVALLEPCHSHFSSLQSRLRIKGRILDHEWRGRTGAPLFSTGRLTKSSPQCGGQDAQAKGCALGGYFWAGTRRLKVGAPGRLPESWPRRGTSKLGLAYNMLICIAILT